jgi:hypothetical protein
MFDFAAAFMKMRLGFELPPAADLLNIPTDVQSVHITKKTLNLAFLPDFKELKSVAAHDVNEDCIEKICLAKHLTHISMNAWGLKNLDSLSRLSNLEGIEITDNTKVSSLAWLTSLRSLQVFALADCPITVDLAPIGACEELRFIWLSSSHSKPMRIASLDALSRLSKLENLIVKNARVGDRKLTGLHPLKNLVKLELPDFFSHKEFLALATALPSAEGYWLDQHKNRAM